MKIAKINLEQHRGIYGKTFATDSYFNPTLDKDGNIFISEIEVQKADKTEFPFLDEVVLKEPAEILTATDEEWYAKYKAELEAELQKVTLKIEETKDPIKK